MFIRDRNVRSNSGKSDYFFTPNGNGQLKVWSYWDIQIKNVPSATIKMNVRDVNSNKIGASTILESNGYGSYFLDKTITNIPDGTNVYFEFEVINGGSNAVITGNYTVSW